MKYTHRVAVMVATQVIMDIEAENDVESIKKEALISLQSGEGDPEQGMSFVKSVVIYPWLEEGQNPPKGSSYPKPTELEITLDEQMLKLIEEQKANAERLAEELFELSGEETDTVLILDALACAGLRIVPMEAGENVASLAMFSIIQQQASEV